MERGNNPYGQETTMQDGWMKIGVLGCNSVIPRNVNEPPTGEGTAVGNAANAATADSLAVGDGASAHGKKSVAIGSGSVASNDNECSVGAPATESTAESTREVTHVSEPTAPTSAATKSYVDDNTSNALVGNVSGKLLHVDDAWPCKPLGLTIDGACKQDGTPSPDNPVPIVVVENPVLKVTGRNLLDFAFPARCASYSSGIAIINPMYVDNPTVTLPYTSIASSDGFGFVCRLAAGRTYTIKAFNLTVGKHAVAVSGYADKADVADKRKAVWYKSETSLGSPVSFTVQDGGEWVVFCFAAIWEDGTNKVTYPADFNALVECGGTVSDFVPYAGTSIPITLPAEHPYLAKLPDGTADTIEVDKEGNVSLVSRVSKVVGAKILSFGTADRLDNTNGVTIYGRLYNDDYTVDISGIPKSTGAAYCDKLYSAKNGSENVTNAVYKPYSEFFAVNIAGAKDEGDVEAKFNALGSTVYAPSTTETRYPLGKVTVPSMPETISNVWTEAELTTDMSMTYKRDINTLLDRDKLPIASTTNRGTVKVGHGLDVDADGTLWVTESDSIPLAQTVTARTSEKNFAITGSPNDVASHKALMPVFNCGGYYSTFGGYFYLDLKNSYKSGTKIHIELDVVWQDTHICSPIHRVAVVEIQQNTYTIPFGPSMYRGPDYNWYYWSFDVPVTADVPAKTQIHVNVF